MRYSLFLLVATLALAGPRYSVEPFAGSDWVGDGGPSRDSLLLQASGLATDSLGNLYISDAQTHRVRRINAAGIIETVAGTGVSGLSGDGGPATRAQLSAPYGLATDDQGNLYIADLGNRRVRRVGRDGVITTIASGLVSPRNLALDSAGNLYISDFDASRVYQFPLAGIPALIAGPERVDHPAGIAVDRAGALYIGDTGHHTVWKWQAGTFAKTATATSPTGLAFDAAGNLLIADPGGASGTLIALDVAATPTGVVYTTDGRLVRRSAASITTVIAGRGDPARGDNGLALEARLNNPSGLALDAQGNLFIADRDNHRIRRVGPDGIITTYAGTGLIGNDGDEGPAAWASLNQPTTLRIDASGDLYVDDSGNHRIRRITPAGLITSAKSLPDPTSPYLVDGAGRLARLDPDGAVTLLELETPIPLPTAVIENAGVLYVAEAAQDRVWKLTPAPEPISLLRLPDRLAPGMIAMFEGYRFTQPEVVFDRTIATILAHTATSLAVLVPEHALPGPIEVDIRDLGVSIVRVTSTIAPYVPQLFAAVNEDGTVNTPTAPAPRGSVVVLYGTGQGVQPRPVSVGVGGYAAEVLYSGPVAGYPGLWQVNARVPGGFLPPGLLPLSVSVGDAVSASLDITIR